jgi:carboxymethylenebutenolidase
MDRRALMHIPFDDGGIPVYLACKDGKEPRPALILIHEAWGLNDHIKSIADRLCSEGFMVLAPDLIANTDVEKVLDPKLQKILFDKKERVKHQPEIRAMFTPLHAPEFSNIAIKKLETCFDYLLSQDDIGKIGVMGFCFGGTYSFNLAINQPELAAAVPFYGHFEHEDEEVSRIMSPILAFYGDKDTDLTKHLPKLEKRMEEASKDFTYKIYPGCGHAFFNDTNALTSNKEAAEDSWDLALRFLNKHLKT